MTFNENYKKQMDNFCNENLNLTASDILEKAQTQTTESASKVMQFSPKKKAKKFTVLVAAAVACTMLASVTALAATGVLGQWIDQIFGDKVTADIVDKGYLYEINQSKENANFRVDLIAVTGDVSSPKVLFDVYINNEEWVKTTDKILLHAFILSEDKMNNEIDNYAPCMGIGVKDENASNLYHVLMDGPTVWLTGGEEVAVKVSNIILNPTAEGTGISGAGSAEDYSGEENFDKWQSADIRYSFTPAVTNFHPVSDIFYEENIKFECGGIEYSIRRGEYGEYDSMLWFEYDYIGTSLADGEEDYSKLEAKLHENWLTFIKDVTLVVDGTELKVKDNNKGYTYCNPETKHCNAVPYFPVFEYENAQNIVLKYKDTSYVLKDGDNIPGEEIGVPDTAMPEIVVPGESTVPEEIITE